MYANGEAYDILGLGVNATQEDIKRAFRDLAFQYHPDTTDVSKKKLSEIKFRQVKDAYSLLSTEQKRDEYDMRVFGSKMRKQSSHAFNTYAFNTKSTAPPYKRLSHKDIQKMFAACNRVPIMRQAEFETYVFGREKSKSLEAVKNARRIPLPSKRLSMVYVAAPFVVTSILLITVIGNS